MPSAIQVRTIISLPFEENTYVVWLPGRRDALVIDPGLEPELILDFLGHSPGHVVFVLRRDPILVFGGDVLFRGSIGRCDFPGSDGKLLCEGIRTKLFALPPETIVYPGHGPVTTVGQEKRTNPYV